ncbi:MAG TPA: hypothetical protein VFI34_10500 [Candidatus Limnocylindrales bacterium]|nr:hypothetical protein [Candidatus Limnocylindrales bacterium]
MSGTLERGVTTAEMAAPSAVVWIDGVRAQVARVSREGRISTCEITRGWMRDLQYLAQVARVIGDRQRVLILGPSSVRLALEREYVAMYRRPDRLVDVEPAGPVSLEELVDRVRALAA